MSMGIARQICQLQEITVKVQVICPFCEKHRAIIDTKRERWKCYKCGKKGNANELLRLVEADFLDKHKAAYWRSRTNKGVELDGK